MHERIDETNEDNCELEDDPAIVVETKKEETKEEKQIFWTPKIIKKVKGINRK